MSAGYEGGAPPAAPEPGDEDTRGEEEEAQAAEEARAGEEEEIPEMMDLCEAEEEGAWEDAAVLSSVLRNISRRIRATPGDRDFLTDFEGITNICKALSSAPHEWKGEAMLVFCRCMPDICRTSNVNRGSLREEGFLEAAVELLWSAIVGDDEPAALAACVALSATCTANDGNKKVAAKLEESTPEKPGAMMLCLDALAKFEDSAPLQVEAICALRTLMTDDDSRKSASEPSAVENREMALSDEGFPFLGIAVERAFNAADACEKPPIRLLENTLLLLREMARRQDFVQAMAFDAKLLPRIMKSLAVDDARVVRGALAALRAFCSLEEVREEIGYLSDGAEQCIAIVNKHIATAIVCEQGFGLFANLSMKKGPIAGRLNAGSLGVISLARDVITKHSGRPDVMKQVGHTLRNVASQDEPAAVEVKESEIFEEFRKIVQKHEGQAGWAGAVDISRQFLREFRMDDGVQKKAVYNKYY